MKNNKPTITDVPPHLTVDDLAGRWKRSRMSIWRMRNDSLLPFLRIGRSVRFRVEDVLRFEAESAI